MDKKLRTNSYFDHALAAVFAGEKTHQRGRRVFEAVDHVVLDFQLAGGDPGGEIC